MALPMDVAFAEEEADRFLPFFFPLFGVIGVLI